MPFVAADNPSLETKPNLLFIMIQNFIKLLWLTKRQNMNAFSSYNPFLPSFCREVFEDQTTWQLQKDMQKDSVTFLFHYKILKKNL